MMLIQGSVGQSGANRKQDVRLVQRLLNDWRSRRGDPLLAVDGIAGPKTNGAIGEFQRQNQLPVVDHRVDPSHRTIKRLVESALGGLSDGIEPISGVPGYKHPPSLAEGLEYSALEKHLKHLGD